MRYKNVSYDGERQKSFKQNLIYTYRVVWNKFFKMFLTKTLNEHTTVFVCVQHRQKYNIFLCFFPEILWLTDVHSSILNKAWCVHIMTRLCMVIDCFAHRTLLMDNIKTCLLCQSLHLHQVKFWSLSWCESKAI